MTLFMVCVVGGLVSRRGVGADVLDHRDGIFGAGAVPPLVRMLRVGIADAQVHAASAIANLCAGHAEAQAAVVGAGAVPLLVTMLASGKVQTAAARAIGRLSAGSVSIKEHVTGEGAVAPLLSLLNAVNVHAQVLNEFMRVFTYRHIL